MQTAHCPSQICAQWSYWTIRCINVVSLVVYCCTLPLLAAFVGKCSSVCWLACTFVKVHRNLYQSWRLSGSSLHQHRSSRIKFVSTSYFMCFLRVILCTVPTCVGCQWEEMKPSGRKICSNEMWIVKQVGEAVGNLFPSLRRLPTSSKCIWKIKYAHLTLSQSLTVNLNLAKSGMSFKTKGL